MASQSAGRSGLVGHERADFKDAVAAILTVFRDLIILRAGGL